MLRSRIRLLLVLFVLSITAGCFPVELDVSKDGKLLISRQEGFFTFDPASNKAKKIAEAGEDQPVFARFSPNGKDVLLVSKTAAGYNEFRFSIAPLAGGKSREVFLGKQAAYVLFSPAGDNLAIVQMSEKDDPEFKDKIPELYLVPTSGGAPKLLGKKLWVFYRWFSDSKRLLVLEVAKKHKDKSEYYGNLGILDVGTSKLTPLAAVAVGQEFHIDLSPDNKKALFTAIRAGKLGTDLTAGKEFGQKLFELDVASGAVRATDKEASYAIYSPNGKKVLMGTPPPGFNFTGSKLEIANADLTGPVAVAEDAYKPMTMGGDGRTFPGWVDDKTVFFFVEKRVYGTSGKSVNLMTVGVDGKGRKNLQPVLEMEVMKDSQ